VAKRRAKWLSKRTPEEIHALQVEGSKLGRDRWKAMRAAAEDTLPPMTPAIAARYVQLLQAGLPPADAMSAIVPLEVKPFRANLELMGKWLTYWNAHPLVTAAIERQNGGKWEDLPLETRITLALGHAHGQLAYFLYSQDFSTVTDIPTLKKLAEARAALVESTRGGSGSEDDLKDFMRDFIGGRAAGPPVLQDALRTDSRSEDVRTTEPAGVESSDAESVGGGDEHRPAAGVQSKRRRRSGTGQPH